MSNQAIGMIETRGDIPPLAVVEAMIKAANVQIITSPNWKLSI